MQAISFDFISPLFKYWHGGPLPVIKKQFIGIRVKANVEKGGKVERTMSKRACFTLKETKYLHDAGLENALFAFDDEDALILQNCFFQTQITLLSEALFTRKDQRRRFLSMV